MQVYFKPVGWDVYCYDKGSYDNKDPIDCVMIVRPHPIEEDTCIVGFAKGKLTHEMNLTIGKQCRKLGFSRLMLSRSTGRGAPKHTKFLYTKGELDWYEADLTIEDNV